MKTNPNCAYKVTYKNESTSSYQEQYFSLDELTDLKSYINKHKECTLFVQGTENSKHIYVAAEIAYKALISLHVNGKLYQFEEGNASLNSRQITIELIKQSQEFVFFEAIQSKLINTILIESPLYYSEAQAIDSVTRIFQVDRYISLREMGQRINMKSHTLERLQKEFDRRHAQVKSCISISFNSDFVYSSINFDKHILDYVADNDGIFILADNIGSGKTKDGLRPLFENFCSKGLKPIFVTPFIALTNKIISDDRNYRSSKAKSNLGSLSGLATCIDSISTKKHFSNFIDASEITIVDE